MIHASEYYKESGGVTSATVYKYEVENECYTTQTKPTTRCGHIAISVDRFMIVWGGYWMDKESDLLDREKYLPGNELWIFDTDTDTWSRRVAENGTVPDGRSGATAVLMDRTLHIFGGFNAGRDLNDLYSLDLHSLTWRQHPYMVQPFKQQPSPRDKHSMWGFDNKLFVFGGFGPPLHPYLSNNGAFHADAENSFYGANVRGWNDQLLVYDLETLTWSNPTGSGACRPNARAAMACGRLDQTVYLFGGRHLDQRMNDLYSLNLLTLAWSKLLSHGAEPIGRTWSTLTPLSSTQLLLYGGFTQTQIPLSDAWLFNVVDVSWRRVHIPDENSRLWHSTCCTSGGDVLVFGGSCNNILDREQEAQHATVMLGIRFAPKSLVKLALETLAGERQVALRVLDELPRSLRDNVRARLCQQSDDSASRLSKRQQERPRVCALS